MILTLGAWLDQLPVRSISWALPAVGDVVETRGGQVQVVETTTRQWEIAISLATAGLDSSRSIEALLDAAAAPGAVVEVTPVPWRGPRRDPDGAGLVAASPVVAAVSTDGRSITISGLPTGYTLEAGDWLSVETTGGAGGRMVRLYRLQGQAAADAAGALGPVAVAPRIDPVVQAGQAVRLVTPIALAVVIPSDLRRGSLVPGRWQGGSLTLRQTLAEVEP